MDSHGVIHRSKRRIMTEAVFADASFLDNSQIPVIDVRPPPKRHCPWSSVSDERKGDEGSEGEGSGPASDEEEAEERDGLDVNVASIDQVSFVRYVDVVPRGDERTIERSQANLPLGPQGRAALGLEEQTGFRRTTVPAGIRKLDWRLLTERDGLPCTIKDGLLSLHVGGQLYDKLKPTCSTLIDGDEAHLQLQPIPKQSYCAHQPSSASATASHVLNNYLIFVEHNGKRHLAYSPLAKAVDRPWDKLLRRLAEYSSAEGGPGRILYCEESECYAEEVGFGVRLRNGGARLPLIAPSSSSEEDAGRDKKQERSYWRLEMPGNVGLHDRWARGKSWEKDLAEYEGDGLEDYEEWARRTAARRERRKAKVVLDFRVDLEPSGGPHDVIFRVVEAERGDYRKLEYALREEGSIEAVREGEWKEVHEGVVEGWAIRFMVNTARISAGREELIEAEEGEDKNDKEA